MVQLNIAATSSSIFETIETNMVINLFFFRKEPNRQIDVNTDVIHEILVAA